MRRLHRATSSRALRALIGIGAVLMLALVASGCAGGPSTAAPTPDPFAGLADRSDQAFRQGLESYGQGQYRDALTSFQQARTLSPSPDPRIDQMLARTTAAMAPSPTAVPATPTAVPVAPTAVPLVMSSQNADTDLGGRYFGRVTLAVVPGRETDSPAATQFFFQDQMGMRIEGLKQHLRLPFTLRVFNTDTARLVGEVQSDNNLTAVPTTAPPMVRSLPFAATPTALPTDAALSTPAFQVVRFWDTYVWYHKGGEDPGRYRAELYANGVLTNSFDYSVVSVPVALPEPTLAPVVEPTASLPSVEDAALPPPPAPAPAPAPAPPVSVRAPSAPSGSLSAPVPPAATPQPTAIPVPTAMPTASTAGVTQIGGLPAGLDVNPNDGRVFIADGSGVVWTSDPNRPAAFNRPISLDHLPQDLAVDASTGNVFVSARNESAVLVLDASGQRLGTIQMPAAPGDLRIDSQLGLVYVVLPDRQALGVIDARGGHLLRTIDGLPQITSLALDTVRHTLYASHLGGQLSVVDVASSQVTARMTLTGVGLSSVATSRGLAYAVNTVTHELAVVEPVSQGVIRYVLSAEPAAIAASEDSGSVYILASKPDAILRLDPTDGTEVGRVTLPNRSGRFGLATKASDQAGFQGLRSRMVLNPTDQAVYVTLPESGTFSLVPDVLFPPLTRDIPWVEAPDAPLVAYSIPGVIRPAAAALPSQPAPILQARAQPAATADSITDQEAN